MTLPAGVKANRQKQGCLFYFPCICIATRKCCLHLGWGLPYQEPKIITSNRPTHPWANLIETAPQLRCPALMIFGCGELTFKTSHHCGVLTQQQRPPIM